MAIYRQFMQSYDYIWPSYANLRKYIVTQNYGQVRQTMAYSSLNLSVDMAKSCQI